METDHNGSFAAPLLACVTQSSLRLQFQSGKTVNQVPTHQADRCASQGGIFFPLSMSAVNNRLDLFSSDVVAPISSHVFLLSVLAERNN